MTVRLVVIGGGYWGKNHIRNFDGLGVLTGFCDNSAETLEARASEYPQARPYTRLDEVLTDSTIDAVAIASPAASHGALARQALEAGKHVFVEKPLCLDIDEARELDALAKSRGLVLMVGHLLRYHPAFIALQESVANGSIGVLRYIHSTRASLGKIRREENALWSFAPHDVSMILALAQRMPERINCHGEAWLSPDVADLTLSHFDFGDGLQAHIFVTWLNPYKDHRLVVVGDRAMIVFDDIQAGPEKLKLYPHIVGWNGDIPVVDKAESRLVPFASTEPLRNECEHFIECVETGHVPLTDAAEGIRVLSVLKDCQSALASRNPVVREG